MPTKLSSYLTELGFKQITNITEANTYNKNTAGEFLVIKENNKVYRYENNSILEIDNSNILNTSDGGNTRWIAISGDSGGEASIPDQSGNAGKFLSTDGSTLSWKNAVDNLNPLINEYLKLVYPIGSIYLSTTETCPLQTLGIGTWNKVGTSLTLSVNTSVPVKGNGKTLGLTGSTNVGISSNNNNAGTGVVIVRTGIYGQPAGSGVTGNAPDQTSLGVTTDSANSGIVGTVTRTQLTVNVFQRTA